MGLGFQGRSVSRKISRTATALCWFLLTPCRQKKYATIWTFSSFYLHLYYAICSGANIFFSYSLLWGVVCFNTASSLEMVCFQWGHLRQAGELTCRLTWPCVLSLAMHLGCLAWEMFSDWRIGTTLCIFKHIQQKFIILCDLSHCLTGASLLRSTIIPQG